MSRSTSFVVTSGEKEYNVDVSNNVWSCGHWENSEIPCAHAYDSLQFATAELDMDPFGHISPYFSTPKYRYFYTGQTTVSTIPDANKPVPIDADKPPACFR